MGGGGGVVKRWVNMVDEGGLNQRLKWTGVCDWGGGGVKLLRS